MVAGEGIDVGDGRDDSVTCMVGCRGGAVTCIIGGSEGINGVWLAAVRASAASGIQRRWW